MKRLSTCAIAALATAVNAHGVEKATVRTAAVDAFDHMLTRARDGGGWANAWSVGSEVTFGEHLDVPAAWITVQPPATPAIGRAYLRAARVLERLAYFEAARDARAMLLKLQTDAGGFPHQDDPMNPRGRAGTFDDGVTTGALDFLIAYWRHTGDPADLEPVRRVGEFLLAAQYESGGYPQAYPPRKDHYQRCITFNDNVMANVVRALVKLHAILGDERYREAAARAGECILRLQGGPGEAIWAQQYDPETLEPAWARKFEPPGYSTSESRSVCMLLIDLYLEFGDERYLQSLERAIQWYDTHRGDDGLYARLYEPETGRPVYGRRDKAVKVYDYANATDGYAWRGDWYPQAAARALQTLRAEGRQAYNERREAQSESPRRVSNDEVENAVQSLTPAGAWIERPKDSWRAVLAEHGVAEDKQWVVHSRTFVRRANTLLDFLEQTSAE